MHKEQSGWRYVWLLALSWGLLPVLPALLRGELVGSPWTDLYPSVWGLDGFIRAQPGFPIWTLRIGAPEGSGFYYSSPLHGWAGWPIALVAGPVVAWHITLLMARIGTVLAAFGAGRALGLSGNGALAAAAIYGASPFFHGYTVEGIVEGTDGWTLALWGWAVGRKKPVLAGICLALTIVSSWYLGLVACVLAAGWGLAEKERRGLCWGSLAGGLVLSAPLLWAFVGSMAGVGSGAAGLEGTVRAAMGVPLEVPVPGFLKENPFAICGYLGWVACGLGLLGARQKPLLVLGVVFFWVLSLGRGPWYQLPILELVRFPYRWHAGTLACLGWLAGLGVDSLGRGRLLLAFLPALEGFFLSRVQPVVPGAPAGIPAIYQQVQGELLLELPGPVALPPGVINHSRPRARYLLYYQVFHGKHSPWVFDFNGVGGGREAEFLKQFRAWDPIDPGFAPQSLSLEPLQKAGITELMVHRSEFLKVASSFEEALKAAGAQLLAEEKDLALYLISK
jgi:hypothetical protein